MRAANADQSSPATPLESCAGVTAILHKAYVTAARRWLDRAMPRMVMNGLVAAMRKHNSQKRKSSGKKRRK